MVSFSPEQLSIKENPIMSCLSGETSQKFSFIQRLCLNAKPQFISLRRKRKTAKETLTSVNVVSAVAWRREGGVSTSSGWDIQVSTRHCP